MLFEYLQLHCVDVLLASSGASEEGLEELGVMYDPRLFECL